jgi:hypothetical protein
MAKNIVYPQVTFTDFVEEPVLKRLALFFDSIYVGEGGLSHLMTIHPSTDSEHKTSIEYEQSVWQFLLDKQIVKTYPFIPADFDNADDNTEAGHLKKQFMQLMPRGTADKQDEYVPTEEELQQVRMQALHNFFLTHDIMVRLDAIALRNQFNSDFYPAVRTNGSYTVQTEKKSEVIQFLLDDIPTPDINTPWEQIVDFRSDDDVKNKYLALINWVNKISNSSSSLSDIKEEYEYLYNDYMKHFKLHKLKYNNTVLELIVTAGAGLLLALQSGEFITSFKNLLQMNLSHIKLMEEEGKLPGKEVAYIYHVKRKFSKD